MTYDPHNRTPQERREGMSGATMAAIAAAAVLGLGALFYAMSDNNGSMTSSTSPSTTTGQSTQPNAPANPPARAPAQVPASK